ncbi:SMP-30/gluconolactonase/LRE family protein [uncultured Cohaesibacter sp.]|uniref:SMP-30/gluconolactonase/LRE family protein n=1 Tax=uncultured Cohaesibacter sp. TaxID=1002546 RepID=UPI0029C9665E|nr:SMP-30/gluconolactonase/LRE family protein [uncultured Cohaesibacter sp.]
MSETAYFLDQWAAPVETVTDVCCTIGESPVWDERRGELFWCDIPKGTIWRHAPGTGKTQSITLDDTVGCLGLCESGRLIVGCGLSVLLLDPDSGKRTILHRLDDPGFPCRLNDGRVGPDGAFWAGTLHDIALKDQQPIAALWRFTVERAERVIDRVRCSNGLAFNAEGSVMIHTDSVGQWIKRHSFDKATGAIDAGELISTPSESDGRPDGGAMDVDGIYWSAGVSAGVLNGYDLNGNRLYRYALPVPRPTMPCFGGEDFQTLYITSHQVNLTDEERASSALSGRLLSVRMARPGFAAPRFDDAAID